MMEYKGYSGEFTLDSESKVFRGRLVGLRDVVTFEGATADELQKAFRDSVDDYLLFCKEKNKKPDRPYSGLFTLHIDPELHERLWSMARESSKSLNEYLAEVLQRLVDRAKPSTVAPARTPPRRRAANASRTRSPS